nr:MAG TPA: hypothetical protein [Bacteriophage sp.]
MKIPVYLDRDNYLQNPIMRRFLKEKRLEFVENRADYIKALEEYSDVNTVQENEIKEWLLKIVKEGSKEFCYRKIGGINEKHRDPTLVEAIIKSKYPNCPMQNILEYRNTKDRTLIEYKIHVNINGEVEKVDFTFSKLMLYGEVGKLGDETVFPIFVELYLNAGMIVSRAKAKSTIYEYDEKNKMLFSEYRVPTMDYAVSIIDEIIDAFGFETEINPKMVKKQNSEMLYKLYQAYSFTPENVDKKVEQMVRINQLYVDKIFEELTLDPRNKERALLDLKILVEKYISINGDNENLFKNDRNAYLIKVSADDEIELTKIDTTSDKTVPLQCTEAFFDSKKSVVKSKKCNKLNLIFKRDNDMYLKSNPLVVQFGTNKNYGYFKTIQYAEEADIQHVLQAIFDHY